MGYSPASAIPLSSFGAPTANISMNTHKFTSLLDGTTANDSAGWDQLPGAGNQYAYVVSGCVWTADAAGSTRNASMTSGTVMVAGLLYTVAAVTAHACTASSDTYVDINIQSGVATVVYTTVTNNSMSPALASSGTVLNTVRIAVITVGASNIAAAGNISQGQIAAVSTGASLGSSTVAAGSNGQAIGTLTSNQLAVASGASFSTGGGWLQVAHSGGQTYTCQYTGVSTNNLTGITSANVLSGTVANTVATGDTVTQVFPVLVTDLLGNPIYPVAPYPKVVGFATFANSFTTTLTTADTPVPGMIAPFVIPTGGSRFYRFIASSPLITSSATAGTTVSATLRIGNSATGTAAGTAKILLSVASDGPNLTLIGVLGINAGSYIAQLTVQTGAAGTLTLSATYGTTQLTVEPV